MYYAPSGESNRRVEPYYLVFQWSSWYVWGWCLERKDYRLFKLNRMDCVVETDRGFLCRDVPMPDLSNEKIFPGGIKVKALFTPNMKWRLVEEFGPNCFTETDDGRLLFSADYTDMENLVTWLMTFGAKVEVLEPEEVRDIIRRNAEEILKIYADAMELDQLPDPDNYLRMKRIKQLYMELYKTENIEKFRSIIISIERNAAA